MTTIPPRSLSSADHRGRRVLRLPNGTGTYLKRGEGWMGDGDPLEYIGWEWEELHDPDQADLTDLTDAELREICQAPAAECEGVIARIAASHKAADSSAPRAYTLSVPDSEEDRILTYPDGSWRWLLSAEEGGDRSETSPVWPAVSQWRATEIGCWPADRKPVLEVSLRLTEAEALSLLPRDGREDRISQIRASRSVESAGVSEEEGLCSLSVESDGDRVLTYPDGSWRWLFSDTYVSEESTLNPEKVRPSIPIETYITAAEAASLLPREGRAEKIAALLARAGGARAPSLRAQGLGARDPVWGEPEDLVAEPPHYQLPGGREALEDVISPICDALSERRLPGSAVYMVGNALKYLSRLGAKGSALEDLRKAREYLDRAIARMDAGA